MVPTLNLAAQTALAWRRDSYLRQMIIVSSMDTAGHQAFAAAQVASTGSPEALAALLSVVGKGPGEPPFLTVICTYDSLGMIWDKHYAAWRARLTAAADYHQAHGHLAAPATTPIGAWLAEQRHLATKNQLDPVRAADLAAIDPHWQLPHGADWHRKYHLLRAHLAAGRDAAALTRDTLLGPVKIGSWLHRQLTG